MGEGRRLARHHACERGWKHFLVLVGVIMVFIVTGFFLFTSMDALYDAHPPQAGVMVVDVTHTDPKAAAKTAPAVVSPTPKVETVPEEKPATTPGVGSPFQGQPCESGDAN